MLDFFGEVLVFVFWPQTPIEVAREYALMFLLLAPSFLSFVFVMKAGREK